MAQWPDGSDQLWEDDAPKTEVAKEEPKRKTVQEMNEVELFMLIDFCGAFIWRMNHDMGHGRIPEADCPAIEADIVKMRENQLSAVKELPRIGVITPLDENNRPTPAYWTWYRTWNAWKEGLTDERWREVDAAVTRGLTPEEVVSFRAEAFNSGANNAN